MNPTEYRRYVDSLRDARDAAFDAYCAAANAGDKDNADSAHTVYLAVTAAYNGATTRAARATAIADRAARIYANCR